jgi:hypothetical protein
VQSLDPSGRSHHGRVVAQLGRRDAKQLGIGGHDFLPSPIADPLHIQIGKCFHQSSPEHDHIRGDQMHDRGDRVPDPIGRIADDLFHNGITFA